MMSSPGSTTSLPEGMISLPLSLTIPASSTPGLMSSSASDFPAMPLSSYTYNEPTVFAEYVLDIARLAHDAGLKNVLVSNGFISDEAASEVYPLMDAANIDMKGWDDNFYPTMCAATLPPVLSSLKRLRALGVHLEVTTLVIPGKNDSEKAIQGWLNWAARNLGLETPLHFSAYFPAYRCTIPPTPPDTLFRIQRQAHSAGFRNVFLGNIRL